MDYYIDGIIKNDKYKWSLKERFGFSYDTVRRYLDLKSHILTENVELNHFLPENEVY